MENVHHNQENLPVLTEIVGAGSAATGNAGESVFDFKLAIMEADPRGYDPYNSAPPLPVDNEAYR